MFGVKETDVVADLGAGTGFYSVATGQIANKGKVYAVEISKDFLHTIIGKVKDAHLNNVDCLWGDVEKIGGTKIGDNVIDKVIASNVFSQLENKENFIGEVKRILKINGEVLFIDWDASSPIPHKGILVSKEKVKEMFETKGFKVDREIDAGNHHYGMILVKV